MAVQYGLSAYAQALRISDRIANHPGDLWRNCCTTRLALSNPETKDVSTGIVWTSGNPDGVLSPGFTVELGYFGSAFGVP